jgi:hypothetical protein
LFDRNRQDTGRPGLAPRVASAKPIHIEELESDPHNPFGADEPTGNRWLLTTCVAGIAGSLVVGSALLGILGSEGGGDSALASVSPTELWQRTQAVLKGDYNGEILKAVELQPYQDPNFKDKTIADRFQGEVIQANVVIPARQLTGSINGEYPSISADLLPYAPPDQPMVLGGSVRISAIDPQNITTIAKTPPPEPIDQNVVLAGSETLTDRLIAMGVTVEAAKALVGAVEPVYPQKLLKPQQVFEVTIDKQQDFYGNEVIYPVRLAFSPGPDEEIVVESDEDGQFIARIEGDQGSDSPRYADASEYRARAKIGSSLYATAKDQGVRRRLPAPGAGRRRVRGLLRQADHRLIEEPHGPLLRFARLHRRQQDLLPLHDSRRRAHRLLRRGRPQRHEVPGPHARLRRPPHLGIRHARPPAARLFEDACRGRLRPSDRNSHQGRR